MAVNSSRRQWLKTSAVALAGMNVTTTLFATEKERYRAAGIILLNGNENPYGPPEAARKAMSEVSGSSNRYPDGQASVLKQQIAAFWNIGQENILLGAGSSEFLGLVPLLVSSTKGNIITAEPSYRIWSGQAEALGLSFKRIPLTKDRKLDLSAMLSATDANTRMIYVCNPNNPVGTHVDASLLLDFVRESSKKCLVFVDEAYTEFPRIASLGGLAIENPNVVVAKTFSKIYGLAGARIGYIIAHPETVRKLAKFQPWPDANVSITSVAAASAALKDQDFVKECRERVAQTRQLCYDCFKKLSLEYIPSVTNFILFNIDRINSEFSKQMRDKNILVQYREHFGGKWCRVSMGTIEEMQTFCSALKSIAG
jgi:histidinol-phosphate aminotransferase